jgi:hypothetical protein
MLVFILSLCFSIQVFAQSSQTHANAMTSTQGIDAASPVSVVSHKYPTSASNGENFEGFVKKYGERAMDDALRNRSTGIWKAQDVWHFIQYSYEIKLDQIEKSVPA